MIYEFFQLIGRFLEWILKIFHNDSTIPLIIFLILAAAGLLGGKFLIDGDSGDDPKGCLGIWLMILGGCLVLCAVALLFMSCFNK